MPLKNKTGKYLPFFLLLSVITSECFADQGDWLVRLRGIVIAPNDGSGLISLGGAPLSGSGVGVSTEVVPELDITYMVTDNLGVEVIAGIANHNIELQGPGPALSGLGLTDAFEIYDTWVLPPTVTLQYHFMPESNIRPYAGLGVNYTAFLWNDASEGLESAIGGVSVDTRNSWGWATQVGVDIDYKDNLYFNLDLKYIDINTEASLNTALGTLRVNVDVDPFVFGAGIGYRF